jgi:glycerate-2-kinase
MKHTISLQQTKHIAKSLYRTAIDSANPYNAVTNHIKRKGNILLIGQHKYNIAQYENIYVVGAGKAVGGMAQALEDILGNRITDGLISTSSPDVTSGRKIKISKSGHPIPDNNSVINAKRIKALLTVVDANDLVIYLASGGGSAMLTLPPEGITLKDMQVTSQLLLKSGATLQEMNCIRKHIDLVKGGQLARDAYPATIITLVISDVVGDQLNMISSGPTMPDPTVFTDAYGVLRKYKLLNKVPKSVRRRIERGLKELIPEIPKKNELYFRKTKAFLIGLNTMALNAMVQKAKSLGIDVVVNKEPITGEAHDVARSQARDVYRLAKKIKRPLFILSGGETTVTVKGNGVGGRNQEYTLAFALEMERLGFDRFTQHRSGAGFICLSCATDGIDYIKEAAGAMVDGNSLNKARKLKLNSKRLLDNNDSYHFHKAIGTLIKTGPTNTNVNDIQIVVVWP